MPAVVPVVAAIASSAVTSALGTGIFASVMGAVVAGGINMAGGALFGAKAKKGGGGGSSEPLPLFEAGIKSTTVNTIEFRELVYGTTRKGGTLLFRANTSGGTTNLGTPVSGLNKFRHMVIGFAGHQITNYNKWYLNDIEATVDGNGWVLNPEFSKNSDTFARKSTTTFTAAMYVATNASGSGTSASIYISNSYTDSQNKCKVGDLIQVSGFADTAYNGQFEITSIATHASGAATRINYTTDVAITTGSIAQTSASFKINPIGYRGTTAYIYDNTGHGIIATDKVFINGGSPEVYNGAVVSVAAVKSTNTFTYGLASTPSSVSSSGTFQRRNGTDTALVRIIGFDGSDSQNIGYELQSLVPDKLNTATDQLKGIACAYVQLNYDRDVFDSIPQLTALIDGKAIYDPRTGVKRFSNNLAMVVLDYMTGRATDANLPYGMGLHYDGTTNTSTRIDLDYFKDCADVCDEDVPLKAGGSVKRYTIDGTLSMGDSVLDNLNKLLLHGAATVTRVGRLYRLYVGAFDVPRIAVNDNWLAGNPEARVDSSLKDLMNTATGVFVDATKNYYPTDFALVQDNTALAADGQQFAKDLQFPFITNAESAQRLAKLYTQKKRRFLNLSLPINYNGLNLCINETIFLSLAKFNWQNKIFRIENYEADLAAGGVTLYLREENEAIYSWDAAEATSLAA